MLEFPTKPTRTTQIRKHYYKLTVENQDKGLVMYLLKYWFLNTFNQMKLQTAALTNVGFLSLLIYNKTENRQIIASLKY